MPKDNRAGVVDTYTKNKYETMMQNHTEYSHPAYTKKEAKELKEIDADSFIYQADKAAKEFVMIKKVNPSSMNLFNSLYGK